MWEHDTRTIWIRHNLPPQTELTNLAHELGHAILGHEGPQDKWGERYADEVASLLLISEEVYSEAERLYGPHPAAIADALDLPAWVVRARQQTLARTLYRMAGAHVL